MKGFIMTTAKWADVPTTAKEFLTNNWLKCYKTRETSHMPEYGSEHAACFDLKVSIQDGDTIVYWGPRNKQSTRRVKSHTIGIPLYAGERMLVPTGIIFDLNVQQSLRIHPRSGMVLKKGITIANCEGVVDADYVQETFVMLSNISDLTFDVVDGMRVAQAEIVMNYPVQFEVVTDIPLTKTDRDGGFGSTGT